MKRRKSRHLSLLLKEKEAEEHRKQLQFLIPNLKKDINGDLIQNGKKININLFKPLLTDRMNGGLFYNPPIQNSSPRLRKPVKRSETNSNNHFLMNSFQNKLNDFKKERQNINVLNSQLMFHTSEDISLLNENEDNKSDNEENNLAKSQKIFDINQIKKKEKKKLMI